VTHNNNAHKNLQANAKQQNKPQQKQNQQQNQNQQQQQQQQQQQNNHVINLAHRDLKQPVILAQAKKLTLPNNTLYQLKDNNQFNELCKGDSNPSCVILFVPVNGSQNVFLQQSLRNALSKIKYQNFYYLWAYAGYFPALERSTYVAAYPALVAINYNKHRFAAFNNQFSENNFANFLQHLNDAKISFANMKTFNNISEH
jgi:hypothetical protein